MGDGETPASSQSSWLVGLGVCWLGRFVLWLTAWTRRDKARPTLPPGFCSRLISYPVHRRHPRRCRSRYFAIVVRTVPYRSRVHSLTRLLAFSFSLSLSLPLSLAPSSSRICLQRRTGTSSTEHRHPSSFSGCTAVSNLTAVSSFKRPRSLEWWASVGFGKLY